MLLTTFGKGEDAGEMELLIRTQEKDVIEQQSLLNDNEFLSIEDCLSNRCTLTLGQQTLLVEEIKRLRLELADFDKMVDNLSEIYGMVTEGRVSKPLTCPHEVIAIMDDLYKESLELDFQERTEGFKPTLRAVQDVLVNDKVRQLLGPGLMSLLFWEIAQIMERLPKDNSPESNVYSCCVRPDRQQ